MNKNQLDYESSYWDLRRKFESLKSNLVLSIAIPTTYLMRIYVYGAYDWYLKVVSGWELIDLIAMLFTFLVLCFLTSKLLNIFYPASET